MSSKWKKPVALCVVAALALACLGYFGTRLYKRHVKLMEAIEAASANPHGLNPSSLVAKIDAGYASLPDEEKRRIAADPKLLSERIESASYGNFKQALDELFLLPSPIRRKIIRNAAWAINCKLQNREKLDAFYESCAGQAALRAASKCFLLDLNGAQKSELKPITDAFFNLHDDMAKRGVKPK